MKNNWQYSGFNCLISLHTKLRLISQSVKATELVGMEFDFFPNEYLSILGSQIRVLQKDEGNISGRRRKTSVVMFENSNKTFPRKKSHKYENSVNEWITSHYILCCDVIRKIHFISSSLDNFPEPLWFFRWTWSDVSERHLLYERGMTQKWG